VEVFERVVVPDDLDVMAPGPELARVLAGIDRSRCDGDGLVTLLRARARQIAHDQAQLLADVVEMAHCPTAGVGRAKHPDAFAEFELACALTWTANAAGKQLWFAMDLLKRLPAVHAALLAGSIDQPKAWIFSEVLLPVEADEEARRIAELVLPAAADLTTAELARKLRRLIVQVDPEAAKRRAERSKQGRRVESGVDAAGTGWVNAYGLPIERTAAAMERLDALARAARNHGDPRSIDQLRADTFLDLLEGRYSGPPPTIRKGVVELTVPLTTLLGLADLPGDLAGWGPVCADIARQTAAQQHADGDNQWRFTVHDDTGNLIATGLTRRRPPAKLAAFIRADTTRCGAPGCHQPATHCELDHRIRHTDGGPTTRINMAPLCPWHHDCKDEGGWHYLEIRHNVFVWISPRNHRYIADRRPDQTDPG
jgi:hypothetical protein